MTHIRLKKVESEKQTEGLIDLIIKVPPDNKEEARPITSYKPKSEKPQSSDSDDDSSDDDDDE
jgi:hypothetical protein